MLLKWNDPAVRLTGRWSRNNPDCATATANGSYFEFAFRGRVAVMHFDVTLNAAPYPHLYVEIDGESRVEAPLDQYLRVFAKDANANHVARVILKGSVEMQPRWFQPLVGRTALLGIEVEERGVLPADDRKIVEFVGDSITEGVLIDADYAEKPAYTWDQHNRVYQDDVTATYGWLTAEALNLRPVMMGYGAVGVTRSGCGGVVRAADAYPYCFAGAPIAADDHPDYVLINHGTNDGGASAADYGAGYTALLDAIRAAHPQAKIFAMSVFCGAHEKDLEQLIPAYNAAHGAQVVFLNGSHWLPPEPIHPLRDGHRLAAEKLAELLRPLL